jgi:hypothetical protein
MITFHYLNRFSNPVVYHRSMFIDQPDYTSLPQLFISPFLIAFLVSLIFPPLAVYSSVYSLLVTEIVPVDQADLPIPSIGDRVAVYGVWVQDTEFIEIGFGGWHEIHPVRYMEINGKGYGERPYSGDLFDGCVGTCQADSAGQGQPVQSCKWHGGGSFQNGRRGLSCSSECR